MIRTTPPVPSTSTSTSTVWPSLMARVAGAVPTTAEIPYSLATTAAWLNTPPALVTTAATVPKSGVHEVMVVGAT